MKKIVFSAVGPEAVYYFLKEQIAYFKGRGCDVSVVTSHGTWTQAEFIEKELGVKVYPYEITRVFSLLKDIAALFKIISLFKKLKPDYIYGTTPKAAFICMLAGAATGVRRRVYLIRGLTFVNDRFLKKFIMSSIERLSCALAHKVLVVSQSNLDYLLSHKLCDPKKVKVLANGSSHGVDAANKFNPANKNIRAQDAMRKDLGIREGDTVFGFLGRMVKDKGVEVLAEAWKAVSKRHNNIHLILIGPVRVPRDAVGLEYYNYFKSTGNIHIIGDVRDPLDMYGIMDILVHPSLREGFPNAVLEAGALEIPVITTDALGCIDSVVHNETGVVVPMNDPAKLAGAMEKLMLDRELARRMGRRARERILKLYDPGMIASAVYNEILSD